MNIEQQLRERAEAIFHQHTNNSSVPFHKSAVDAMIDFHKQELQRIGEVVYVPVSVEDRSQPMPNNEDFILLFDDGSIHLNSEEEFPFAVATHWLKKLSISNVGENSEISSTKQ